MISNGVDHPGLLLLMYPRPVFVAAAVLDFFPIEGTHQTFREVSGLYTRFGHADRISMREGYHEHQYSPENQEAAIEFLDHFNGMPRQTGLPPVKELDEKTLQCTHSGQVMLEFDNARSAMDLIRDHYLEHKAQPAPTLKQLYYSELYPGINRWRVAEFQGGLVAPNEILWAAVGSSHWHDFMIDRYLLRHNRELEIPLLWIHGMDGIKHGVLFWNGENGKIASEDWPEVTQYLESGYDIVSIDPRGLGETRMQYKAVSPDDPALAQADFDHAYVNPLSSVLADYVYNSLLTGRPYFLQMIEDVEIARRFVQEKLAPGADCFVAGNGGAHTLASAVSETLPDIKLVSQPDAQILKWSELVERKQEMWPIQDLLPGGAYIH